MATMGTQSSEAADLLEKLSLDSQTKSLEVPQKKFGSLDSRTGISSMAKPYERSMMPVQDLTNLNMYYSTNGYTSYYPGGFEDPFNLWNEYRYLNYDGADLHSGLQQRRLSSEIGQSGHLGNSYRSGSAYGLNYYNPKSTWNAWQTVNNKYPSKGLNNGFFSYGNENKDSLNELSKGPRGKDVKNQLGFGYVKLAVKGQDLTQKANSKEETLSIMPDKQQYNKEDFAETYSDAKFFVIKSYSEDDVHKSIKYNVWASTPTGNQKLDAAYHEAKGKNDACPVFLLFSVNASGQFVGLAEMVGPVDFNKNMDFWQQDKWTGCFPVKWHIVKDVPNSLLKHITLENNDNKPVTNSRDTQEVKLEQAVQVVKIFKTHLNKTSILDDFEFYETRQKALQEKKAKRLHYQKQVKNENSGHVDSATAFTDASAAAPNSQSNTLEGSVADISKGEKNGATDEV